MGLCGSLMRTLNRSITCTITCNLLMVSLMKTLKRSITCNLLMTKMCSWRPSELCFLNENSSIIWNLLMKNSGNKSIGATFRIGREIRCLPYAARTWQDLNRCFWNISVRQCGLVWLGVAKCVLLTLAGWHHCGPDTSGLCGLWAVAGWHHYDVTVASGLWPIVSDITMAATWERPGGWFEKLSP